MSQLAYFRPGKWGDFAAKEAHYSLAVRVGDTIEISGQGGWDPETLKIEPSDEASQIARTFANVDTVLRAAGATNGWGDVFKIRSYSAPITDKTVDLMVAQVRKYCPDHKPTWTALGIDKLALEGMCIEIEVTAYVGKSS